MINRKDLMIDWNESREATIEYNYALGKKMDIMFQEDINLK